MVANHAAMDQLRIESQDVIQNALLGLDRLEESLKALPPIPAEHARYLLETIATTKSDLAHALNCLALAEHYIGKFNPRQ